MSELVIGTGAAVGAGAAWWAWRAARTRRIARERLQADVPQEELREALSLHPALRRHHWVPVLIGLAVALACSLPLGLSTVFSTAFGLVAGVLSHIVEEMLAERRAAALEVQLATAIDLMVAALNGGAALMDALDSAARESKEPLRSELQEILGRLRFGESPQQVFEDFAQRIPLEAYRIFCFTLGVHVEVGGSLAPTLSTVGRSVRDRIEIARRIRAQSTEARGSVMGIVCVVYFLGLLMWRTNPASFESYVRSPVGQNLLASALVLQAVGMLWIARLSRLRF